MPRLENPRHEKFAQEIAKGQNGAKAYRKLGLTQTLSARVIASRLLSKVDIVNRVQELQQQAEKKGLLTMQRRRELLQERAESPDVKDSDLVNIVVADAKMAGEWVEKTDLTSGGQPLAPPVTLIVQPHWRTARNGLGQAVDGALGAEVMRIEEKAQHEDTPHGTHPDTIEESQGGS